MTKEDLIYLTIKQLKDSFRTSPESLILEDSEIKTSEYPGPTIIWRHMLELNGQMIQDPNNATRTIVITYNKMAQQLTTNIYFRDVTKFNHNIMPDAAATFTYKYWPNLYRSYRLFNQLRSKLIHRHHEKQNMDYIKKLTSIFPAAGDDDLLG
jgi:hypothetical protein